MRSSDIVKVVLPALASHVAAASNEGPFSIYAYGPGFGGLPLFSSGDGIFAGNFSRLNSSQAAPVQFTLEDGELKGSPNTTGYALNQHPTWSNKTIVVPGPSSSSHAVRMINDTADSNDYVSSFMLYGSFVMMEESGEMLSLWYGEESDIQGVYTVGWNATITGDSSGRVPLTLKKTAPSGPPQE
ncbi:hypothetical protein FLONG3_3930 [Fusarium longipes]|uniref:Uncharacterized protein n=1 Tax=Fusarium longipes TaxID=694270 RepID=A0A395SZR4_9HYPO|nr:hypothetical protein FLONG3_3930 [Fusarium longipes]